MKRANTKKASAFTLIELLIVIGIIGLLISILLPALNRVQENARRVVCGQQLRQIGVGLRIYEGHSAERLPGQYDRWGSETITYQNQTLEPWVTYVAWHQDYKDASSGQMKPLQLATLTSEGCINDPELFYCPAYKPQGVNLVFTYGYYTQGGTERWGEYLPVKNNGSRDDKVRVSYHYWLHGRQTLVRLNKDPVVFDNLQHWTNVAHTKDGAPYGFNALFGDGHVAFTNKPDLLDPALWNGGPAAGPWDGPGNSRDLFLAILARFEE